MEELTSQTEKTWLDMFILIYVTIYENCTK